MLDTAVQSDNPFALKPDAKEVFLVWEKLRLVYNAVLFVMVLAMAVPGGQIRDVFFWMCMAFAALQANVCFCAAPVAEGYLAWMGFDRRIARCLLLVWGMLISVWLTYAEVKGYHEIH